MTQPPSLWRSRDYLGFWTGDAISSLGSSMSAIGYPLLILFATGSVARAGIVTAARPPNVSGFELPATSAAPLRLSAIDTSSIVTGALPNVFDMFAQGGRQAESDTGGLGIGLALVKGLVEMHGGTVTAASDGEGKGSTFIVKLAVMEETSEPGIAPARIGRSRLTA